MAQQLVGRLHARLSRGGLDLAETSYRRGQRIESHVHDRPMLVFVEAGTMTERVRRREVECPAGTALFHPAGEAHAHRFRARGSRCLILQLGEPWLQRFEIEPGLLPGSPVARRDVAATGAARLLLAEFRRGKGAVSAALDGLALALIASLARTEDPPADVRPGYLRVVLERLHGSPAADPDLAALARLAGVTPEHLARTFRREQGCTIAEYVRRLRIERARRELTTGDLPLGRLALELGFYDQPHFTRTFKSQVGCTPGEYRRRALSTRG